MTDSSARSVRPTAGQQSPSKRDFPFYNGKPTLITASQWWFIMAMLVLSYLILIAPVPLFASSLGQFIPVILFPAIPLIGLMVVARQHWTAIFKKVTLGSILLMIGFAFLNIVITFPIGILISSLQSVNANPDFGLIANLPAFEKFLFVLKTAPSLFGEEVMSILSFLALLYLFTSRMGWSKRSAILCSWVVSAMLFGLAHLPTYNWNLTQCLFVIGSARIALTLAYIYTKNIWVSTGAHIINDWTLFIFAMFTAGFK